MTSLATRHVMQANKSANTKPELRVRQALRAHGLPGYRLHWKSASGRPDICYPGRRVAIFVNGCYWHHCPRCNMSVPKTNTDFWKAKFARNQARDLRNHQELARDGWTVLVVWEHQLKGDAFEPTMRSLLEEIDRASTRSLPQGLVVEVGHLKPWQLRHLWKRRHGRA